MTFEVLLLKCTGTDPLTGQVCLASLVQHNMNVICLAMARRTGPLPGNLCTSRKLADVSQLLPEPSAESGKGQSQGWHQQAELLSGNIHPLPQFSTVQQWGVEGIDHLVHEVLLLNVL